MLENYQCEPGRNGGWTHHEIPNTLRHETIDAFDVFSFVTGRDVCLSSAVAPNMWDFFFSQMRCIHDASWIQYNYTRNSILSQYFWSQYTRSQSVLPQKKSQTTPPQTHKHRSHPFPPKWCTRSFKGDDFFFGVCRHSSVAAFVISVSKVLPLCSDEKPIVVASFHCRLHVLVKLPVVQIRKTPRWDPEAKQGFL